MCVYTFLCLYPLGSLHIYYIFQFSVFYGIIECVNNWICLIDHFVCSFPSLCLFSLIPMCQFCFIFDFIISHQKRVCFLIRNRKVGGGSGQVGRQGVNGRSRKRDTKIRIFYVRKKKTYSAHFNKKGNKKKSQLQSKRHKLNWKNNSIPQSCHSLFKIRLFFTTVRNRSRTSLQVLFLLQNWHSHLQASPLPIFFYGRCDGSGRREPLSKYILFKLEERVHALLLCTVSGIIQRCRVGKNSVYYFHCYDSP